MALKVVGSNPIIHPRKDTRLDTFFKSGISFLCWNDAQNWVLFQLFCYIVFVAARSGAGTVIKAEMGKGYRLLNRNP